MVKKVNLHRFDQVYLHDKFENGLSAGGLIEYVRLFSVVAVFVLLIACVNFMNLATCRCRFGSGIHRLFDHYFAGPKSG